MVQNDRTRLSLIASWRGGRQSATKKDDSERFNLNNTLSLKRII